MQPTTAKNLFLALILASAVPLAACGGDTPTSPTQQGPPVSETPPPPTMTAEPPAVDPPPADNRPVVSITGPVVNLARSGPADLDVSFRIDDFTIVRVAGTVPVTRGSFTYTTAAILWGQTVTVEGRRTNGFLDATSVSIISPP